MSSKALIFIAWASKTATRRPEASSAASRSIGIVGFYRMAAE
jgi:hypothetical protein